MYGANYCSGSILKIGPSGAVSKFVSTGLSHPSGLAFDGAGNLYVSDGGTKSILKVTPGKVVSTFATGFNNPLGMVFDSSGNLYVADSGRWAVREAIGVQALLERRPHAV